MTGRGACLALSGALLLSSASGGEPATIPWRTDEKQAFAEAARSGRPLLVDAWADCCAGCKLIDQNTWSDRRVQEEVAARFVPLRVDLSVEDSATEARMQELGVSALPAVLICPPARCDARAPRLVGYARAEEMLVFLRRSRGEVAAAQGQ